MESEALSLKFISTGLHIAEEQQWNLDFEKP